MRYQRALELFFLKAKEEFDKRKTERGGDTDKVKVNYFGCTFEDGKIQLNGQRIVYGGAHPLILPENHIWKEGAEIFETIMKDLTE